MRRKDYCSRFVYPSVSLRVCISEGFLINSNCYGCQMCMECVGRYSGCSAQQESGAALSKNSMFMGGKYYIQLILCKVCIN